MWSEGTEILYRGVYNYTYCIQCGSVYVYATNHCAFVQIVWGYAKSLHKTVSILKTSGISL